MAELKDSGGVREFGTGAHRDAAEGKGRCDLLPLEAVGMLMESDTVNHIALFVANQDEKHLVSAMRSFLAEANIPIETGILEASKQYEDGANKYGANNWKKGMPLHVFIDCALRHYIKWHRGDQDEPHDRATMWNLLGAMWTLKYKPELNDFIE